MPKSDWCIENDFATQKELAEMERYNGMLTRKEIAALLARVARLEEALREIRDYSVYEHPDVQVLNHRNRVIVEITECTACQHAKQVKWPPSGLCSKHYAKYQIAQRRVEEMHDYKQTWEPREIARRALEEK